MGGGGGEKVDVGGSGEVGDWVIVVGICWVYSI